MAELPEEHLRRIRKRAEARYADSPIDVDALSEKEVREIVEELRIHQIELEMQNEELREIQQELREARDRLSDLYDFAPVGYVTIDHAGTVRRSNLTASEMLGAKRSALAGTSLSDFVTPDSQEDLHFFLRALTTTARPQARELWMVRRSGGGVYARIQGTAVSLDPGEAPRFHVTLSDVTDLHQAEVARDQNLSLLQASDERFRTIFESAAMGIALIGNAGQILATNPALEDLLGRGARELRGERFISFLIAEKAGEVEQLEDQMFAATRPYYKFEHRYRRGGKKEGWARITVSLVRGSSGGPQFAIGMVEDISEQRTAQNALIRSEKLAITGRLAASLAHEINNPLQAVLGCLMLADETLDEGGDIQRYLDVANDELRRAARIVTRLRDLNRPAELSQFVPTNVNDLLDTTLTLTEKKAREQGVNVSWEPQEDLRQIPGVPDRIQQIFLNLMLNAIDAMPGGGELRIRTEETRSPAGLRVTFSDTGVGIPAESMGKLFDPFFTSKESGIGLGLYITHHIVQEHGGEIVVKSEPGEGSTFRVWLPG